MDVQFQKWPGKWISGPDNWMKTLVNQTSESCATACLAESGCRGVNFARAGGSKGDCNLRSTNALLDLELLRNDPDWNHYAIIGEWGYILSRVFLNLMASISLKLTLTNL